MLGLATLPTSQPGKSDVNNVWFGAGNISGRRFKVRRLLQYILNKPQFHLTLVGQGGGREGGRGEGCTRIVFMACFDQHLSQYCTKH